MEAELLTGLIDEFVTSATGLNSVLPLEIELVTLLM